MALQLVNEEEIPDAQAAPVPLMVQPPALPAPPNAEVAQLRAEAQDAFSAVSHRLVAVERAMGEVPAARGLLTAMLRALGSRDLSLLALFGCVGLAVPAMLDPGPWRLATLCAFSVLVYAPLVVSSYWGKE